MVLVKTLDPSLAVFSEELLKILEQLFYGDGPIGVDVLLAGNDAFELGLIQPGELSWDHLFINRIGNLQASGGIDHKT